MNRTRAVAGVVASAVGAGIIYNLTSPKDTSDVAAVARQKLEANLNPIRRTSPQHEGQFYSAIKQSQALMKKFKDEVGTPGVVIGVGVDGTVVWEEGLGLADVENGSPCHADTAMRIASISKSITSAILAKLWENGQVDLDKPIQEYVPNFPKKKVDKEEVVITTRQLACHKSGIRHYEKKGEDVNAFDGGPEFYIKERFTNLEKSIDLFKSDELLFKPGTSFRYTTHGYTLISAVIEKVAKKPFTQVAQEFFRLFGLKHTYLDEVDKIIYGRSSYYTRNKEGRLVNAELADTSYKWAGGGFISTVGDLVTFGNALLYCYQQTPGVKPGFLKKETISKLWTVVEGTSRNWGRDSGYGLGWTVVPHREEYGGIDIQRFYVGHGGGAVGASSILIIVPTEDSSSLDENQNVINSGIPRGISVAVLTNLQNASCLKLAREVAELFYKAQKTK